MLRRPRSVSITFRAPGEVVVEREKLPRPGHGAALLTARCSLISTGTERRCLERDFAPGTHWDDWVTYPFRPGYSFVGTTASGARVCARAPHAQRVVVEETGLITIPAAVSDESAACFALAAIAEAGVAAAPLAAGDPVVVIGAGMLGQLVAQFARLAGAGAVIVVARGRPRLDVALAHGATAVVAADAAEAKEEVMALTGGEGAAVVVDVTGEETVLAAALRLARPHGTVVLLGDAGDPGQQRIGPELLLNGLHVVGVHALHSDHAEQARMARDFFAAAQAGEVVVDDLITARVSPSDAPAVYASLKDPDPTRLGILFDWSRI